MLTNPPLRSFASETGGATAILVALSITGLMGFAGLAVDVGLWYADARSLQDAADSAAYSSAVDLGSGDSAANVTATGWAVAASYGLSNGSAGVAVSVNMPPTAGPNTSTTGAVEVVISKPEDLFFTALFLKTLVVSARAVAIPGAAGGKFCVQSLDQSAASSTVTINNGAAIDTRQCGLEVNGASSSALSVTGGASVKAANISVVGNVLINNGGSVTATAGEVFNAAPVPDPYAGVTIPTPGGCTANYANFSNGGQHYVILPGTYCNGLQVSNGATLTMSPGVYIINGGQLSFQGGTTVNATGGVTIVLTGSGSNFANAQIANGTNLNLTAPSSGPTAGLAIAQDRSAPSFGSNNIAGGATLNVVGALYFPHQSVIFSNGTTNASSCTQLIAYDISFVGGSEFKNQCANTGVSGIGASKTVLVE